MPKETFVNSKTGQRSTRNSRSPEASARAAASRARRQDREDRAAAQAQLRRFGAQSTDSNN